MQSAVLLIFIVNLNLVFSYDFSVNGKYRNNPLRDLKRELIDYPFPPRHYSSTSDFSQYIYRANDSHEISKREVIDPIFKGNPKTREEMWHQSFNTDSLMVDTSKSLVALLVKLLNRYLIDCIPVVLYDIYVEKSGMVHGFFKEVPISYIQAMLNVNYTLDNPDILNPKDIRCRSYILFLSDVMQARKVLGPQIDNRVIIVARSTQWKVQDFLSAPESRDIVNLIVISKSYTLDKAEEPPYVLYTHKLYIDGLGSNRPQLLTSWMKGKLSRPHVDLFPNKLRSFSGHRLTIAAINQPPFIYKQLSTDNFGNIQIVWDGVELRLLQIMAKNMNFSLVIVEPPKSGFGFGDAVTDLMNRKLADLGMGGLYITEERTKGMEMSASHSVDCAGFLTLTSRSLPRSRAILGPFQWPVWVCLTFTYMIAIFPLAYSDKLTLTHLWSNLGEIENMFWYVFGTFTNSLTFTGENSWSGSKKDSTRLLIGVYWIFTIIITACYTGSIIAFVTLPVAPENIDTLDQLKDGFFRIGTYDRGGWERWFLNATHEKMSNLMKKLEFVSNVEEGFNNVTQAWFFPYAFIASQRELQYVIETNYTENKIGRRSALHASEDCIARFNVAFGYKEHSVYRNRFNEVILRMQASGLIDKLFVDISYDSRKLASGKQQAIGVTMAKVKLAASEERSLNLADTEGMFIFLAIGFIIAFSALFSEWVGGCTNRVLRILKKRKDDREEAERVEKDRLEHEEHPQSRKSSIFSRKSKVSPRSRSDTLSSGSLNKQTLKELYNGPDSDKSTLCMFNNSLIMEADLHEAQRKIQLEKEGTNTPNSTPSTADSSVGRQVQITAEVLREGTPSSHKKDVLGEEVIN